MELLLLEEQALRPASELLRRGNEAPFPAEQALLLEEQALQLASQDLRRADEAPFLEEQALFLGEQVLLAAPQDLARPDRVLFREVEPPVLEVEAPAQGASGDGRAGARVGAQRHRGRRLGEDRGQEDRLRAVGGDEGDAEVQLGLGER